MFLSILLSLALVQEPVKPQVAPEELQKNILHAIDSFEDQLEGTIRNLETGEIDGFETPQVGLFIRSDTEPGSDGLHALRVLGVYAYSPAGDKDVHVGDRILRIGQRRIEHETDDVARLLLQGKTDDITLELQRGSKVFEVVLKPRRLGCFATAIQFVGRAYLPNVRRFQEELRKQRNHILSQPNNTAVQRRVIDDIKKLFELFNGEFQDTLQNELAETMMKSCAIQFK